MSPVRTTRSASGPASVRSYGRAQSFAWSPVAATGTMGAGTAGAAGPVDAESFATGTVDAACDIVAAGDAAGLSAGSAAFCLLLQPPARARTSATAMEAAIRPFFGIESLPFGEGVRPEDAVWEAPLSLQTVVITLLPSLYFCPQAGISGSLATLLVLKRSRRGEPAESASSVASAPAWAIMFKWVIEQGTRLSGPEPA